jgi:hypothetical protein
MNSLVKVPPYSKLNFQGKIFFTQNWCNITLKQEYNQNQVVVTLFTIKRIRNCIDIDFLFYFFFFTNESFSPILVCHYRFSICFQEIFQYRASLCLNYRYFVSIDTKYTNFPRIDFSLPLHIGIILGKHPRPSTKDPCLSVNRIYCRFARHNLIG